MNPPTQARLDVLERTRVTEQSRLDATRSLAERNRVGQFATPEPLALGILELARELWPRGMPVRFLDPAVGTGAFYSALLRTFRGLPITSAGGIEIDRAFVTTGRKLWAKAGLKLHLGDFTRLRPPPAGQRATLLVANPPYVRHHHLDVDDKHRLQTAVASSLGIKISGLAGLYCYFLLLAHRWMDEEGLALWLVPSEFLDVNYGSAVCQYLREHVSLVRLHRFDPSEAQFADALVSSAVVVFRKAPPTRSHEVLFTYGGSLSAPRLRQAVPLAALRGAQKWSMYPHLPGAAMSEDTGPRLADFFEIKRGIATGANEFFILPRARAKELGIPEAYTRPILPSPRYLRDTIIEAAPDGHPLVPEQLVVIDTATPEECLAEEAPALHQYLQRAKPLGLRKRYLVSKRSLWYRQEQRPAAPFLSTYMGRGAGEVRPFRFIWNKSQATAANVYLLLYPRENLKVALQADAGLYRRVFDVLRAIDAGALRSSGRVYGGALHKVEPRELGNLSALPIADLVTGRTGSRQRTLFDQEQIGFSHKDQAEPT